MLVENEEKRQEEPEDRDEGADDDGDKAPDWEDEHLYDDWDDLAGDPEEVSRLGRALEGWLPDIVKRGVGGLVSDEGLRSMVRDRELPREAVGFILGQVDSTKREVARIVSKEVRTFLENVDLGGELTKILTSVSFEVRTEVRFIPNDSAVKPNVRNRMRVKGTGQGDDDAEGRGDGNGGPTDDGDSEDEDSDSQRPTRRRRWSFRGRADDEEDADENTDQE